MGGRSLSVMRLKPRNCITQPEAQHNSLSNQEAPEEYEAVPDGDLGRAVTPGRTQMVTDYYSLSAALPDTSVSTFRALSASFCAPWIMFSGAGSGGLIIPVRPSHQVQ